MNCKWSLFTCDCKASYSLSSSAISDGDNLISSSSGQHIIFIPNCIRHLFRVFAYIGSLFLLSGVIDHEIPLESTHGKVSMTMGKSECGSNKCVRQMQYKSSMEGAWKEIRVMTQAII